MNQTTMLTFVSSLLVPVSGDLSLLGAQPDLSAVYLESYDSVQERYARVALSRDGVLIARGDEETPLTPPPGIIRPRSAWSTMALNFAGARHEGIRAAERVDDLAHPMAMPEKLWLSNRLGLKMPAPMILGWIESYSLAEAEVSHGVFCVCRRLRAACALMEKRLTAGGDVIDYESAALYVAHLFRPHQPEDVPITELAQQLPGPELNRPMDCLVAGEHLVIADGGDVSHAPMLHLWRLPPDDKDEQMLRRRYGS